MSIDWLKISKELYCMALNKSYSGDSLIHALSCPIVTSNDRQALLRYLYGSELPIDHIRLQEIAIYIKEYSEKTKGDSK